MPASSRNRWVRLGLQTAFGLALLWLWTRTVSLPEVFAHMRVGSWWPIPLMILFFLITSVIRARRWLLLLRTLAPVGIVRAFAMNATGGLLNSAWSWENENLAIGEDAVDVEE